MIRLNLLIFLLLLSLSSYGQNIWTNTWSNQLWYKPTAIISNGDTGVFIKTIPFVIFTREFIKGENAKRNEVLYRQQFKSDSLLKQQLINTNEVAAKEIINQVTQKDSIKTNAIVAIAKEKEKGNKKVKNTVIGMSIGWVISSLAGILIGAKLL